jgi:hypothetical protein
VTSDPLLDQLRERIAQDPQFLAQALPALATGTTQFVANERQRADGLMSFALLTALAHMRKLNPQSASDRNSARVLVVYGRIPAEGGAQTEKALLAFVAKADADFPEEAAKHYATLGRSF